MPSSRKKISRPRSQLGKAGRRPPVLSHRKDLASFLEFCLLIWALGFLDCCCLGFGGGGHRFCFVLTGSHQLTHPVLTLPILLSQPHRRWNCRRTPPFLMWPTLWKHSSSIFFFSLHRGSTYLVIK